MAQPRRVTTAPPQAPPAAEKQAGGSAAAAAATAAAIAAVGGTGGGPSAAAAAAAAATAKALGSLTVATAPSAETVSAATLLLLKAMDELFRGRRRTLMQTLTAQVNQELPGAPVERVNELARRELEYELEFQRKVRARLERELPTALGLSDPTERAAQVGKILEREKRFLQQREQAAAARMVGALEMDLIRRVSPEGAYWQLSPLIREHCPKCLAMAGKFWPWEVLDLPGMHLPVHPNCGCRLLGLEEAMTQGLMDESMIPDTTDAVRRAKGLIQEAERLERELTPEGLARVIQEMETDRIQEAAFRQQLRFSKGFEEGGEFRPRGGGNPGKKVIRAAKNNLDALRSLVHNESPAQSHAAGRGRRVSLLGQEHHVPQATHWSQHIGGVHYQSPAGGTHLYRDGILMPHDHPDFAPDATVPRPLPNAGVPADSRYQQHELTPLRPPVQGIPDYTGTQLTIGKSAGGSNGAVWGYDKDGDKWLVKTYRGDQDRIATELLSNAIYREMGATVPEAGTWGAPGIPDFAQIPDSDVGEPELPKDKRISTGMIVREPDGRIWIYEPKGHFGGYEHTFPKGGLEKDLSPQQNAHKELWEETGLHAHVTGFVGDYKGDSGTTRYYMAVRTGGEPHPDDPTPYDGGSETAAVKLVEPEQAAELLNRGRDQKVLKDALEHELPTDTFKDNFPPAKDVPALVYQGLPGETRHIDSPSSELGDHYMTDALLANWDFIGSAHDNVLWHEGKPIRLDQGGTLQFRAQGQHKAFGAVPTEVWTLNSPKGGQAFGTVRVGESSMRDQASEIARRLTPERIDALVDQAPFQDTQMREEVRSALKSRVQWMKRYADGEEALPAPLEGNTARAAMADWQSGFEPFPEQHVALTNFLTDEDLRGEVQTHLRAGKPKAAASEELASTVKNLDSLLRQNRTDDDMTVYVPWDGAQNPEKLLGQTMMDRGYLSATTSRGEGRAADTMIELVVPSGSRALYTPEVEGVDEAVGPDGVRGNMPGAEVLFPRGSRMKFVDHESYGKSGGIVKAVMVP